VTPRVSVCIPVYNGEAHIRAAVQSVLRQTYQDFELVIVNNNSSDGTVAEIEAVADERVRLIHNDETVDVATNWTIATNAATGRYVKIVCADDALAPDALERQLEGFQAAGDRRVALVAGQRDVVDADGRVIVRARGLAGMDGYVPGPQAISRCIRSGANPLGEAAAVLVDGEILRAVGPWQQPATYMFDLDMWFRILGHGALMAQPGSIAIFRVHRASWSSAVTRDQARDTRLLYRRYLDAADPATASQDYRVGAAMAEVLRFARGVTYILPSWALRRGHTDVLEETLA
jgi:glycosyltransferase involved in cell wall biosynthesis